MKEMKDIRINRLPSITWHALKINDKSVLVSPTSEEGKYVIKNGDIKTKAEIEAEAGKALDEEFNEIESATGKGFINLVNQEDIAPIYFSSEKGVERDASVRFIYDSEKEQSLNRVRLNAAQDSNLTFVMDFSGDSSLDIRGIVETRIKLEKNARVNLVQVHRLSDSTLFINDTAAELEEGAELSVVHVVLSGKNINIGCEAVLRGDKSSFNAFTGYMGYGKGEIDFNYVAKHLGKNTESKMLAKGSIGDEARKTYRGTIDFVRGCAGAKGEENEEVLLMSDDVVNKTIPIILCAEEDVEGEHGASIGQLSDEILYYMQSRGIPKDMIYELMAGSGVNTAIEMIPDEELKEELCLM